jgi:GNAT superfamily N-acetyltransferase
MEFIENFAGRCNAKQTCLGYLELSKMVLPLVCQWPKLPVMSADSIPNAEIRRAEPEEADEAFSLAEEYFVAIGVVLREDRRQFLEEYFGDGKGFWTARVNGELAGCIALRSLQPSSPLDGQGVACAEIKRMYLRQRFRGKGIAQRLLETAEEFAREAGYAWIYLDTTNQMLAAAKLYERNGFIRCGRYNQNPQAAIFMRKKLKASV